MSVKNNEKRFNDLLEALNKESIYQKSSDFFEDIPSEIWEKHFKDYKIVAENLEPDKHRHYETTISVIEIYGNYLGIRSVTQLYSEMSSFDGCFFKLKFIKMRKYITTTFVPSR